MLGTKDEVQEATNAHWEHPLNSQTEEHQQDWEECYLSAIDMPKKSSDSNETKYEEEEETSDDYSIVDGFK